MLVNLAVVLLRRRSPEAPRSFRVPFSPVTPVLGVGFCVYMLFSLGSDTWVAFGAWMAVGLVIYWLYGIKHSKLADKLGDKVGDQVDDKPGDKETA
jgi:APA family basic amino acid/polyamine antiporter